VRGSATSEPPPWSPTEGGDRVGFQTDPRVDRYIASLPEWQQRVCSKVRDLVHAADAEVTETIKRTKLP